MQQALSGVTVAFKIEVIDYASATSAVGPSLDALMTAPAEGGSSATPPLLALLQSDARLSSVASVTSYTPATYLAPPPSPPPPPPLCGNGALDPGETCDEGFGPGLDNPQSAACDTSCQLDVLYACTDWTARNCTCNNAAGTFAVEVATKDNGADVGGCAQTPCTLYPNRCLANGAGCTEGSWLTGCVACKIGYYRSGGNCKLCGDNTAASAAAVAVVTVLAGLVGYRAAQILDNTSTALIKGIVSSMQYISINVDVNIKWPDEIIAIGRWFSSINLNIDIIAPECVSGNFNWYYIFWMGAVIVPAMLALILALRQLYLRRAYVRTVISIDGDDTGYFVRAHTFFSRREVKRFHSPDGSLVIAELQRQYQKRVAVRTFAVLALTVMYLPVVRLCLQSYECIYHGTGYVLEHDTDLPCDAPFHRFTQAVASLILLVVGLGVPFIVLARVRSLRLRGGLDGARELTSWGALYDIYRRPLDDDDLEDEEKRTHATATTEEKGGGDSSSTGASKATPSTIERADSVAHKRPPTRFERVGALLAVHYLTVELIQKFVVVVCTSPRAADVAAGLLVVVYAAFAAFVYWTQPWRDISLRIFGRVLTNALNRVEVFALLMQSVLVIIPWVMNGAASAVASALLTTMIVFLLILRTAMFISERLSFLRERKVGGVDGENPEVTRRRTSERMLELAMKGDETRLHALKAKVVKARNRLKARYESTRDAIMLRAASGQGNRAMLELARGIMESANRINPKDAPSGTAGANIRAALKLVDGASAEMDAVSNPEEAKNASSSSLELTRMISAHQRAIHELVKLAREYADAERVQELIRVANEINNLKRAVQTLPNRLGEREAEDLMSTLGGDACLGSMHRAVAEGDVEAFAEAVARAAAATLSFVHWCESESEKLAVSVDDESLAEVESTILRVAQSALVGRSTATMHRVRAFTQPWRAIAIALSKNKWDAAVVDVRRHNEEMARATLRNDFDATERSFTAAHDAVETFIAWCGKAKQTVASSLTAKDSATTRDSDVVDVLALALTEIERCESTARDPSIGILKAAANVKSKKGRPRQLGADVLHA